jgi:hypothetical protein
MFEGTIFENNMLDDIMKSKFVKCKPFDYKKIEVKYPNLGHSGRDGCRRYVNALSDAILHEGTLIQTDVPILHIEECPELHDVAKQLRKHSIHRPIFGTIADGYYLLPDVNRNNFIFYDGKTKDLQILGILEKYRHHGMWKHV